MTHRRQMSEREKLYFFVFLFPPLWPLGLAMLLCDAANGIAGGVQRLYRRLTTSAKAGESTSGK